MKTYSTETVLKAIYDTVTSPTTPVAWSDIMKAVEAQVKVTNWLKVRGVLQYLVNEGAIKRTPSVEVEAYIKCK